MHPHDQPSLPIWRPLYKKFTELYELAPSPHITRTCLVPRIKSVISAAIQTCIALGEVASSYAPYGLLQSDPPTSIFCKSVVDTLTNLSHTQGEKFDPTHLFAQMRSLESPKSIQAEQKQLLEEYKIMSDPQLHGSIAKDCLLSANKFLSHTPLPEFWANKHPGITVFWRALLKFDLLLDVWDKWSFNKDLSVWTDVNPEVVMLFFQDLLILLQHTLWHESHPIPMPLSLWSALSNVFHCTVIMDGSVWGPAAAIHPSPSPELEPFTLPRLPERSIPCILPRIVDVAGAATFSYFDNSRLAHFLHHTLDDLISSRRWAMMLAPDDPELERALLELEKRSCACRVAVNVNVKRMCTFFPKYFVQSKICTWWRIGAMTDPPDSVHGLEFFQMFGPLVKKHGGTLCVPPLLGLSLRTVPKALSTYFRKVCETEASVRSLALRQTWNPKLRRVKSSFDWQPVPRSWDTVNRAIPLAGCKLGRLISQWRMTQASVSEAGAWIYIVWAPNFSQCYIGQTGARDSFRCVFDRGKEHLVNTRDWTLLHRSKRGRIPLYEWVNKVGVHNVIVTPLERVPTWAADSREIFWMYRFGTSHLLNRSIPNLRQMKWAWLLKTKSFAKTLKKSESATANTKARADSFIRSGHCTLTLHEMV